MCAILFFMWQTGNSLAIGSLPALAEKLDTVFTVHYLIAGFGLLICGLICDKIIRSERTRRLLAATLSAVSGIFTLSLLFIDNTALYITFFFIATFLGFGANSVLLGGLFVRIGQSYKPLGFGLAFAAATLLRVPIDLYATKSDAGYIAYIVFAAAALFLLAGALLTKHIKQSFAEQDCDVPKREPMDIGGSSRLVWIAVACGAAVYVLFGIFDNLVSDSPLVQKSIIYFRLAQIISSAAVGFICLRFGYYAAVISSISFLGVGTLAHLFSWSGVAGLICGLATIIGFNLFTVPLRSIFAEVGKRGKYPYTVASFGFALYFITQVIGIPIAGLMKGMDRDGGMALYIVLFMLVIPAIMLLFYALRNAYHAKGSVPTDVSAENTDMWVQYNLSRREKEILALVLTGKLSREIAEELFVSESTVNWHVSNILKKTGAGSRAKLMEWAKSEI